MRVEAAIFALWCLVAPSTLFAANRSPHDLFDAINTLQIDPAAVYDIARANRVELHRGDAVISFEEGKLAFFLPLDGLITGAVFSGRGHILAIPRDPVEKQQMGLFLGAPVLDQDFLTSYLRFTDGTADELLRQVHSAGLTPQPEDPFLRRWEQPLTRLNPLHSLRILFERLTLDPKPYFCANLDGTATGPFDVLLDSRREEPFLLGQSRKVGDKSFYDIWTSHKLPNSPAFPAAFRATHYSIETSILSNNSLVATATVQLRAETGTERFVSFQLSRALGIDTITDEHGGSLAFFQNEGMNLQERNAKGNDYLTVVLSEFPSRGQEFTLRFHYQGNVIEDAGNDVLFVGARESWYPHLGEAADFAGYDLTMRWPRRLLLVATGTKLEEREDGDFRIGRWQTEKPISVAGFNLGEYASASVTSGAHSVDVHANRQLEQALRERLSSPADIALGPHVPYVIPNASGRLELPAIQPSPADALKQLGKEIESSIRFYESFSGPFPFRTLSVSQIPGTFGQGWPGLLYISTYSFLSPETQQRAGLSTSSQELFTELVPYHEVVHQWWGNVVGWNSYRDQWINEAIANYLALLFADSKKNPDRALHVWLARFRRRLIEKPPGSDEFPEEIGALTLGTRLNSSKSPEGYEDLIYSKGPWIIHMLREMLRQPGSTSPDARFTALLHTLVTKYAYRALSTNDLQREAEAVMTPGMDLEGDHSMEWFFEEWVRGTGIPHYRVEFTARHTEKGYLVRGKLFQTRVPRSFVAGVPLYASGAGHNVLLGLVVAAGPETSFHFTTSALPLKIVVDPQSTLLCTTE
jgi:hypothetical protein